MVPELSIVVPVFRESDAVTRLLTWFAECPGIHRCEIVVVDGDSGSTEVPRSIVPVRVVQAPAGRGVQLNTGALLSNAPNLLFLHVDTILPGRFVDEVLSALDRHVAGAFDLRIDSSNPVIRMVGYFGRLRSRITRVPYGDQAIFIRRDIFETVGCYPEIPILEDVALMDALKARGWRIGFVSRTARTSARRWQAEGIIRTTLRNWRIMIAYRAGVPASRLVTRYRPQSELRTRTRFPWRFGPDYRIVVFYRSLRPGHVKTRLAEAIGQKAALSCYRAMLGDLRQELRPLRRQVRPFVDSPRGRSFFRCRSVQRGADLWERMANAFDRSFDAGAGRVVLIGSDIPGLTHETIRLALARLNRNDAVLGVSSDGGFYLIGFTRTGYRRDAFDPAHSATGESLAAWLRSHSLRVAQMPTETDVDTVEDLVTVLSTGGARMSNLRRALRRAGQAGDASSILASVPPKKEHQ